ncbi:TetR/AcrR family transcriptional regulator [Pseudomonas corrugata]|uniref:TetR/AcrR family transcriptional regulator n=1 Tax=Pseudomonas corrugata TaxID=47879 RepID=UPI0006D8B5FA|nr:TetR/AcrR family transcriptional regulator [Pseudomonas corrugata]
MTKHMHAPQIRGPSDHSVRDQVVEAATLHFGRYGYEKTTVSDIAKTIGFSKAYIYKFFDSKQAIGEVICSNRLVMIMAIVDAAIEDAPTASEKLKRLFRALVEAGSDLFFHDRKLYDIAAVAAREQWLPAQAHDERLRQLIRKIVLEGRESGEFEGKTPLDEAVLAIHLIMKPYANPVQLQYNLDTASSAVALLSTLMLRSLSAQSF